MGEVIHLEEITEDNFEAVIAMKRPEDEHFVASNCYSLAQAWLYRNDNDVFPYAIYLDDTPVGFILLEEDEKERELWIWRIMFPEEHANKGYGSAAIRLVIDHAKTKLNKYDDLCVDCAITNERARHVYEKLGFRKSGRMNHGDEEMRLPLHSHEADERTA